MPIFVPSVLSFSDYYPFGMRVPNRHKSSNNNSYRYGYQGSEKDDEVKGEANSYTTRFRQLDVRLGRWLSIDPKATAFETPYSSMSNNPITYTDKLGDTIKAKFRDGFLGIFGKKHTLTYNQYKGVWMEAGKVYKGELPSFYRTGLNDLNTLYKDKDGRVMIDQLNRKEKDLILHQSFSNTNKDGDNHLNYSGRSADSPASRNVGGIAVTIPSYIVLGHELRHKFSNIIMHIPQKVWTTYERDGKEFKLGDDEIRAVHFENQLRARAGLPLREFYVGGLEKTRTISKGTLISSYKLRNDFTSSYYDYYNYKEDCQIYNLRKFDFEFRQIINNFEQERLDKFK